VKFFQNLDSFIDYVLQEHHQLDCLVLENGPELVQLERLRSHAILLPAIVVTTTTPLPPSEDEPCDRYHEAELNISETQLDQLNQWVEQAVQQFLKLSPDKHLSDSARMSEADDQQVAHAQLASQQQRLAVRLKERLGYLGVYYKRNPENFLRYLPRAKRQAFLEELQAEYRQIILNYFLQDKELNQKIDHFVHLAFFADVSVAKIVELHMELMDEFAKQLKLEGRSEEILLDYRLTLIDVIAHLCEMYRRSIPRES
jgi:circadian clock protein KaiA